MSVEYNFSYSTVIETTFDGSSQLSGGTTEFLSYQIDPPFSFGQVMILKTPYCVYDRLKRAKVALINFVYYK
ncbi:hypothetical protein GCM10028816_50670 [Spirosoma lituiforme]